MFTILSSEVKLQSHFQSLRKTIPKLNSLEFAKALWEATELRLDTDPSHGQPMLRMHLALCKMAKSRGLFGFRWFKEQVELRNGRGWFLKPNEHCEIVGQCLAWFSLGCSSTIWTESVVLNSDAWVQAPFQAKCLQNHCESDSSQPLGLGET